MTFFYDYRTNVDAYPKWRTWMREKQPRLLVLWGRYDLSFDLTEPEAYRRDVPKAEVHILDAGHFALDDRSGSDSGAHTGLHEIVEVSGAPLEYCHQTNWTRPDASKLLMSFVMIQIRCIMKSIHAARLIYCVQDRYASDEKDSKGIRDVCDCGRGILNPSHMLHPIL